MYITNSREELQKFEEKCLAISGEFFHIVIALFIVFLYRAVVYQAKIGKHPEQFIVVDEGDGLFRLVDIEGVELVEKLLLVFTKLYG